MMHNAEALNVFHIDIILLHLYVGMFLINKCSNSSDDRSLKLNETCMKGEAILTWCVCVCKLFCLWSGQGNPHQCHNNVLIYF